MSLESELSRLQANVASILSSKDDIMAALASKGVTVPSGATLHDVPFLISSINGRAPDPDPEDSVLIGGRWYHYVRIGNQLWLDENLDYKFDVDGSTIPIGSSGSPSTPAAWYYSNDESTYGIDGTYKCGLLYNWHAAKYLNDNLLPDGWHVPSNTDWNTLVPSNEMPSAGTKLKALDYSITSSWPYGWNGTNDYGFNATPSGTREDSFIRLNSDAYFWSMTEYTSSLAYSYYLSSTSSMASSASYKKYGYSIRLVRDIT